MWATLYYLSGQALLGAGIIAVCGAMGAAFAYSTFAHVRFRIDKFFAPTPGDNSQLDRAMKSFSEGGFLGRGPGEGTIKTALPDAHTDFIFAVVAEEYGVIACLVLLGLFAFVVMRALIAAAQEKDAATRLVDPGAGAAVRPAGADQHGRQRRAAAGQRHHAAVRFLGRIVDAGGIASRSACCWR